MKLNISLFKKGDIDKAIKEIEKYQQRLVNKTEIFIQRLAEIGVQVAKEAVASGHGDSSKDMNFSFSYTVEDAVFEGILSISSTPHITDDGRVFFPHLAWEFGSGIHFNNGNINPKAHEFGMGVGTFPDQTHALSDYWWYRDSDGNLRLSQGTEATMPMYKASIAIMESIENIAREVFKS